MSGSDWFTSEYDYSGYAEAVFEDPHAEFFGPASVRPDEHGQPTVEMTVERSNPPIDRDFDLLALQFGSKPVPGGGQVVSCGGGEQNRCTRLTVRGEGGVFECRPGWCYSFSSLPSGESLILRSNPLKAEYVVASASPEKFWVLPLLNFVTEFPPHGSVVRGHPLAVEEVSKGAGCIPFRLNDTPAFIAPLPGYSDAVAALKTGSLQTVVTAVAVADLTETTMTDPWGWFLSSFLWLLDFATGSEVGAPWIELRDQEGHLVRRLHLALGRPALLEGYGALQHINSRGTGEFLTAALSSKEVRESFFLIALRHCFRAGRPGLTLDDQVAHVIRALECVCSWYTLGSLDLTDGLDSVTKDKVSSILRNARDEVRSLAATLDDSRQGSQILKIAERVVSAAQKDRVFGLAVEKLANRFGLLDPDVLRPYYQANPGPRGRNWVECLSYYRGSVFHEGFIDLDSPAVPVGAVFGFILHLHDFLVRVLLKIIGYAGRYQPRLIRVTASETADWFRPGINVDGLLRVPTMGLK